MVKAKKSFLAALGGFCLGTILSVVIFIATTPFCNESCPIWIVDTIYSSIIAAPPVLAVCFHLIFKKKAR
jgi:hypothetical protein